MSDVIFVMDAAEAYDAIVDCCVDDLETAYGDEGCKTTSLSISCDDIITDIEVSYDYSLGIDHDCDTNTYAVVSACMAVTGIEANSYDQEGNEVLTDTTRALRSINERQLALDVAKRLDNNYM